MNITNGQIAFEAYSKSMGGKTYDGKDIPHWEDISPKVQEAWGAAASAVAGWGDVHLGPATSAEAARVDNAQTRNRKVAEAASAGKFEAAKDGGMVLTGAGHDATGVNPNNEERQSQVKRIEAERKAKAAKVAATRAKAQKQAATKKSK